MGRARIVLALVLMLLPHPAAAQLRAADGLSALEAGDTLRAREIWEQLATRGDVLAQYNLAVLELESDPKRAQNLFKAAAKKGHPDAQRALADLALEAGDWTQARRWFRVVATAGDARAQMVLAALLDQGMGGPANTTGAAFWYTRAAEQGVLALDAPVSGGDVGARDGTLAIMVGGDQAAYDRVLPLFEVMGRTIRRMGPAGAGQHTKMVNQTLVAAGMTGTVEALLYAVRAGLNPEEVISVVGQGAAASWAINNLGLRIARDDMEPGFMIRHVVTDLGIALEEAKRMGIALPGLAQTAQFYHAAIAEGLQDKGTQALYRVYQRLNGLS